MPISDEKSRSYNKSDDIYLGWETVYRNAPYVKMYVEQPKNIYSAVSTLYITIYRIFGGGCVDKSVFPKNIVL